MAQKMVEDQAGELWGNLAMCFFHPFSTNKNWLFHTPKGTPYSRNCFFKLRKKVD